MNQEPREQDSALINCPPEEWELQRVRRGPPTIGCIQLGPATYLCIGIGRLKGSKG